ncbi:hypothetical protein [Paenibacillus sp. ATY16]|uniref:hypothetical protein n=1 Tax=Paenibacillus sp. ATY16 TaxID=1759312 RepID=UPI00200E14AA|nr:hypothetical protein [Paenibacillus sp. ATY16]MCK9861947.1 hypothetical protein [Paenibacillus sp. ATY16]
MTTVTARAHLMKGAFILSGTAMTGLVSLKGTAFHVAIGVVCSFLILCWAAYKSGYLDKVIPAIRKKDSLLPLLFAAAIDVSMIDYFYKQRTLKNVREMLRDTGYMPYGDEIAAAISIIVGIAAFYFLFLCVYLLWPKLAAVALEFARNLTKLEKRYLIFSTALLAVVVIIAFNVSSVFYETRDQSGEIVRFDVVYTTDTADLVDSNVYLNISSVQNDLKQPLFGLFALPFAIVGMVASKLLFFVPYSYPIMMQIIQVFLLQMAMVLISRMLKLRSIDQLILLLFLNASYPVLMFSLNMEQYIFSLFWLILFLYSCQFGWGPKVYYFIGAAGSLLTSAVLFPLLSRSKELKGIVKDAGKVALQALVILILFGRLPLLLEVVSSFKENMEFTGAAISSGDKWLQYVNFVASCFVKPGAGVDRSTFEHVSYQLHAVHSLNILGLVLMILAVAGFLLHYKHRFMKICVLWVSFSFLMLCVVGWGTAENGLILYSLYFSWAFMALLYMLIDKLLARNHWVKYSVHALLLIVMIGLNAQGLYDLIRFGAEYYPV